MGNKESRIKSSLVVRRRSCSTAPKQRRGMTLAETLVVGAVLALVLIIVALGVSTVRTDLKRQQVKELLTTLDAALSAYHSATGQWPDAPETHKHQRDSTQRDSTQRDSRQRDAKQPKRAAGRATSGRFASGCSTAEQNSQTSADHVIAALAAVPASRAVLDRIPAVLWIRMDRQESDPDSTPDSSDGNTLQDAWGQRLQCWTATSPSPIARQAIAANDGKPIFISAGVDGQFGSSATQIHATADNLRTDELPR